MKWTGWCPPGIYIVANKKERIEMETSVQDLAISLKNCGCILMTDALLMAIKQEVR